MAFYKVWLTVRDRYGNTKEVEGGNIKVDTEFDALSKETLDIIEGALPFSEYIKRDNLDTELEKYATDEEVAQEVTQKVTDVEEKVTVAFQEHVATVVEEKIVEAVEEKVTEAVEEKETIRYGELEFRES